MIGTLKISQNAKNIWRKTVRNLSFTYSQLNKLNFSAQRQPSRRSWPFYTQNNILILNIMKDEYITNKYWNFGEILWSRFWETSFWKNVKLFGVIRSVVYRCFAPLCAGQCIVLPATAGWVLCKHAQIAEFTALTKCNIIEERIDMLLIPHGYFAIYYW